MARTTTGVDVGHRAARFLRGAWKGNTFHADAFALVDFKVGDLGAAWNAVELPFKPNAARIGLTGREVNIRYTRVPSVPDWQLRKLMSFEVAEIGDQSGTEVASDFNVLPPLPEIEGEDVVLLGMARETLLDTHMDGLDAVGGKLDAFSPNALALYNAWLRFGVIEEETVLIANVGHETVDVVLVRGPDLLFARNLTGGSKLFDDAIAERFSISGPKAEDVKVRMADLTPGAKYKDPNAEKASRACQGAAGQLLSLLQSTVMFCKSQVKLTTLRLDKVLLCGGGARMKGLAPYLSQGMNVPVDLFDPFRVVEVAGLDPESADLLEDERLSCVVALGLATMASDPESYSIEILPARIKKRREFWGGPALTVAAGVLAALFLVFDAIDGKAELDAVSGELQDVTVQWRRAERVDADTERLLAENEELRALALDLHSLAGSGEQVARTLGALYAALPELFWITHLSSSWRSPDHLDIERSDPKPVLHLEGRAREGATTVANEFDGFLKEVRERLPGATVKETLDLAKNQFTIDLTMFNEVDPDAESPDSDGAEDA